MEGMEEALRTGRHKTYHVTDNEAVKKLYDSTNQFRSNTKEDLEAWTAVDTEQRIRMGTLVREMETRGLQYVVHWFPSHVLDATPTSKEKRQKYEGRLDTLRAMGWDQRKE